ncbi:BON domain-containing protein [Nocardia aurantia]|uniref:BON domain-containing protein n=1 Tax=Nocardia aurantia TaxID=2585199 RepID=A0A7K0DM29_9NOCA|nr:BON domain-containing protein [Nocardia aurantia]MQY25864.1 hypothetical protein [Nocardia aurantia]
MAVSNEQLLHTLTRVVNTLSDSDVQFAVAGGCAVYARGGPPSDHDVDIFVKPADAEPARAALVAAGLRADDPPEDWLIKAYDGEILVDLIFRPAFHAVTDELFSRSTWMRIGPAMAPVISGTDLLVDKLMVLDPQRLDFTPLLHIARGLREQVDWPKVRENTATSPYARAFLSLLDDLGISDIGHEPGDEAEAILPQYLVANLRRAFAEDDRTAELGVGVTIRGGTVVLSGDVTSVQQRERLARIVAEHVPKLHVHNDVRVITPAAPTGHERL